MSVTLFAPPTKVQGSFPGATVTVFNAGTVTLATIFNDDIGTPKANPFTADTNDGMWFFYGANQKYDVQFSGGGIPAPFTVGALGTTATDIFGPAYVSVCGFAGTDAGQQISAAVAAIPATGGVVDARCLTGNQIINSTIVISKPIRLLLGAATFFSNVSTNAGAIQLTAVGSSIAGLGPGVSILTINNTSGIGINLFASQTSVRDMTVRGNCTAHCGVFGAGAIGINSGNSADVELDNVVVERWNNVGVNTGGGVTNWRLSNMVIQDNYGDGMFFGGGTGHMISQSVMRNNGSNGVDINSDHTRVIDCHMYGNGYNVGGVVTGIDTNGLVITSVGQSVDGCEVIGCHSYSNIGSGIRIRADQSLSSSNHIIANNVCYSNESGIVLDLSIGPTCGTTNDILITGNQSFNNTNYGILAGGGAGTPCVVNRCQILNNSCINNGAYGIAVAYGNDTQIKNNVALGNTTGQLYIAGSTRTLDFANKTDATVNLCTLGNGTLALNTIEALPPGNNVTLTGPGNTALIWASAGAGYNSYSWFLDNTHNFNLYDATNATVRATLDQTGLVSFNAGIAPNGIQPFGGGAVVNLNSTGSTQLQFNSTAAGRLPWALFIDQFGNLDCHDITNNRHVWQAGPNGALTVPAPAFIAVQNFLLLSVLFASLGTPVNGTIYFCGDCNIANPCTGGGSGAIAKRLGGVWVCN